MSNASSSTHVYEEIDSSSSSMQETFACHNSTGAVSTTIHGRDIVEPDPSTRNVMEPRNMDDDAYLVPSADLPIAVELSDIQQQMIELKTLVQVQSDVATAATAAMKLAMDAEINLIRKQTDVSKAAMVAEINLVRKQVDVEKAATAAMKVTMEAEINLVRKQGDVEKAATAAMKVVMEAEINLVREQADATIKNLEVKIKDLEIQLALMKMNQQMIYLKDQEKSNIISEKF
ncbi:unnamed protein product [Rotaria magnacalcarata]